MYGFFNEVREGDQFFQLLSRDNNKKVMTGRPKIVNSLILRKLREAFLMGCTDREACFYAQIGESTLYDYQKQNPEFSELKQGWKVNPILMARITIYHAISNPKIAMWYLERKCPEEFAVKVITNNINATLIKNNISVGIVESQRTDYSEVACQAGEALKVLSKKDHLV